MKFNVTQEVKKEIDKNLSLHTELAELINKIKTDNGVNELNANYLDPIRVELKTGRYSYDDLTCCVPSLVTSKRITEKDGTLIVQAFCAVNDENEEYFLDDSADLKALIKELYLELNGLTEEERNKYFDTIRNDKYDSYIYQRAVSLIGIQNPLLGF